MMAECCALSAAMREVMPLRSLAQTLAKGVGLDNKCVTTFKVNVWEDNVGALTLANLDPGQNTPRSKWHDFKAHWFRSHLNSEIKAQKIDTKLQLADVHAKCGTRENSPACGEHCVDGNEKSHDCPLCPLVVTQHIHHTFIWCIIACGFTLLKELS